MSCHTLEEIELTVEVVVHPLIYLVDFTLQRLRIEVQSRLILREQSVEGAIEDADDLR